MNIREPTVILEKTKSSINFNCVMGDSVCVSLSGAEERAKPLHLLQLNVWTTFNYATFKITFLLK